MASKKKKNSNFLNAIKNQSEEQRRIAHEKISSTKNEAIMKAEKQYEAEAKKYINKKLSIIESEIKSEYAIKDLNSQGELYRERDNMVSAIFTKSKEKLLSFTKSDKYKAFLIKSAKEIFEMFQNDDCIIYLKSDDIEFSDEILKLHTGKATIEADNTILIGGIKGFCQNKNIVADNTLDSKLEDEKTHFTEKAVLKIF